MTAPTITLVADPDSTLTPNVPELNEPQRGIVAVAARPNMRRHGWLATDILSSLGHERARGNGADGWAVATARLVAALPLTDIQHLVVGNAETLKIPWLRDLAELCQLTDLNLWLVHDTVITDAQHTFAKDFGAARTDHKGLKAAMPTESVPHTSTSDEAALPSVPDDGVLTFLATARKTLHSDDFNNVHSTYSRAFYTTEAWVRRNRTTNLDQWSEHLLSVIETHKHLQQIRTAVRGTQAAALHAGLLLKVDDRRFLSRATASSAGGVTLTTADWAAIARFGTPRHGAVAALSTAGLPAEQIAALLVSDVSGDGSRVRTSGAQHHIDDPARQLLVAQHLYRLACNNGDPAYLAGNRKEPRLTPRGVTHKLDELTKATHFAFRARYDRWNDSLHWRQQTGIAVLELTR